ncbi:MAG: A/G-specific adenine glycosylase [Alphaproteobacteria bacterium]|nr:A/G-specific adenine glycosylase [Alphaproteobacteria bacterium]
MHAPLLRWYREQARDLPWRADPTPYKVLLSELMCQQTRVETALPYFERFVERWPTLEDLAGAGEDALVEAWAGLGYYSRARSLHRCAVAAVERGGLPATADALRELPGIGPYTAGAIASIAFGQRAPAVDGNIQRVISRVHALDAVPSTPAGSRAIWGIAEALHASAPAEAHPGDLNQALMELGARVCTPRNPRCDGCPVAPECRALAQGWVDELPRAKTRKPPVPIRGVAGILAGQDGVLIVKRPPQGLLGGLWSPPVVMEHEGPDEVALVDAFARAGLDVRVIRPLGTVIHVFSHRHLTAEVYEVRGTGSPRAGQGWADVRFSRDRAGVSGLGRKILDLAADAGPQLSLLAAEPPGS